MRAEILMRTLEPIVLAVLLFFPALCRAEQSCLWLNAATAGGVLGGPVTATVSRASANLPNPRTPNAKSSAGPTSANPEKAAYAGNAIDDSECVFVRKPGSISGELRIEVRTMSEPLKEFPAYAARCGEHATALKAIGNEAAVCTLNDKPGELSEQVVGRVRDRVFVVRLSVNEPSLTENALREKARKTAEQVAGSLF
jgi:hypothetical protein